MGWLKFIWVDYLGEQDRDTVGDQQMLPKVCLMFSFLKPSYWCMATYHIFNIQYLLWLYLLLCVMKYSTLERKLKMPHQGEGRDWRRLTLDALLLLLLLLLLSRFSRVRLCATPWTAAPRLPRPWDSPGKNTGVGCHFLLQCMKVKSESEVAQSCPTPSNPMDCSPPGPSTGFSRQEGWSGVPSPSPLEVLALP